MAATKMTNAQIRAAIAANRLPHKEAARVLRAVSHPLRVEVIHRVATYAPAAQERVYALAGVERPGAASEQALAIVDRKVASKHLGTEQAQVLRDAIAGDEASIDEALAIVGYITRPRQRRISQADARTLVRAITIPA